MREQKREQLRHRVSHGREKCLEKAYVCILQAKVADFRRQRLSYTPFYMYCKLQHLTIINHKSWPIQWEKETKIISYLHSQSHLTKRTFVGSLCTLLFIISMNDMVTPLCLSRIRSCVIGAKNSESSMLAIKRKTYQKVRLLKSNLGS